MTNPELNYDSLLEIALHAAKEAGKLMLQCVNELHTLHIDKKSSENDLVTQYDKACENLVRSLLAKDVSLTQGFLMIGEETYTPENDCMLDPSNEKPVWVIDPIDGTTSFVHKSFDCCVSIGLVERGEPVLGVVHIPFMNETFTAIKGRGAFRNGEKIHVAGNAKTIQGSLISVHHPTDRSEERLRATLGVMHDLLTASCHGLRTMGSAAMDMCGVAMGRLDAYVERGIWSWDISAGAIIVREAGGVVVDFEVTPLILTNRKVLCAASMELVQEIKVFVLKNKY